MPYVHTRDIKRDVLFRASEPIDGTSDWDSKVIEYINRVNRTLCTGVSEFLPEYVDDWWWLRASEVLTFLPVYNTGFVAVTQGSTSIIFNSAPVDSLTGRRLKVVGEEDIPLIASHTGGASSATLDQVWTGETNVGAVFKAMKVDYSLSASVQALMGPIVSFGKPLQIPIMSPERMDGEYPLGLLDSGVPMAAALISETAIRFSHGGMTDGSSLRLEARYRPVVSDLTDSELSIPLIPLQWRHLLSDMALTYLLIDKNDDRSNAIALGARTGLAAMLKDNRRRNVKIDTNSGHIRTRNSGRYHR